MGENLICDCADLSLLASFETSKLPKSIRICLLYQLNCFFHVLAMILILLVKNIKVKCKEIIDVPMSVDDHLN